MAIPRANIEEEIQAWLDAIYGKEVRQANVSALRKLAQQINDACDGIEDVESEVENMTIESTMLPTGEDPTASVSVVEGALHISLGIPASAAGNGAVLYTQPQELADTEKAQARENIGVFLDLKDTVTHTQYRLGIENGIMFITDEV